MKLEFATRHADQMMMLPVVLAELCLFELALHLSRETIINTSDLEAQKISRTIPGSLPLEHKVCARCFRRAQVKKRKTGFR